MKKVTRHNNLHKRLQEVLAKKDNQVAFDILSKLSKATQIHR